MFDTLHIRNSGEIACRIAATARRLGVRTVGVYSEADANARHLQLCDEAWPLGPAPAVDSYLRGDKLIRVARQSGAVAVHPGYGFLAENAAFAEACQGAGLVFVGPPAAAIRAMGSKSAAKALLEPAGVPLVPGYHGDDQDPGRLAARAEALGYPLMIKARAGGGGKGMRRVQDAAAFPAALAAAEREARAAFGDGAVLLEKYLAAPRHVEVQVFADHHGNAVTLLERDCSLQRRHQKLLEEAPAPFLSPELRTALREAALAVVAAVDYRNAGTVEFLVADGACYFLEMNTRLQVEHPVTEMVTGLDLVEWQLLVAAGEPLPVAQGELQATGHAVEVRLCAEDPARGFLPATGVIEHLVWPAAGPGLRIDSGVQGGSEVTVHYDSLLAKLIVWDRDRRSALGGLKWALDACRLAGVTTNLDFLRRLVGHEALLRGDIHTHFIDQHREELQPPRAEPTTATLAAVAVAELTRAEGSPTARGRRSRDPHSPWHDARSWRLNGSGGDTLLLEALGREWPVAVGYRDHGGFELHLPGGCHTATGQWLGETTLAVTVDGVCRTWEAVVRAKTWTLMDGRGSWTVAVVDPTHKTQATHAHAGSLKAPMPGVVSQVLVNVGQRVTAGETLLILEAMKMEHPIQAPLDGTVVALPFPLGAAVGEGASLVDLRETPGADEGQG
ncbi:MAG: acetyl/propionyl/methylcrotonyl-CoA carboxylase subunit alpha [Candidatus Competibacterales bacterium]